MPKPSAQAQIRKLQRQLRETGAVANDQAKKITALNATISLSLATRISMMKAIRKRDLEISRQIGYIDRVREMDGKADAGEPAEDADPFRTNALTAERLLDMSDADFDAIVSKLPPGRLDELLGKPDATDED